MAWLRIAPAGFFAAMALGTWAHAQAAECERTASEIFEAVSPSVVIIITRSINPFLTRDRVDWGAGSGVVVDDYGLVITNSHVVHGSNVVSVALGEDGVVQPAKVVGDDPILDLALLRVEGDLGDARPARFGRSDDLRIGETVVAVGNSFGLGQTVSKGIVSGLNRRISRFPMRRFMSLIQTDAAINPGNSGGPLLNACGEVVGINVSMVEKAENIGFAIPSDVVRDAIEQLAEHGRIPRPWHGIDGKLVDARLRALLDYPLVDGLLVETIEPGSPAERAGLRAGKLPIRIGREEYLLGGDVITRVNGIAIDSVDAVMRIMESLKIGAEVHVEYSRLGSRQEVRLTLPERPVLPGDLRPPRKRCR